MKERPILFSGPMVRAILDGSKTQTRRLVKPDANLKNRLYSFDHAYPGSVRAGHGYLFVPNRHADDPDWPWSEHGHHRLYCPHGQPGDRLWVKETWRTARSLDHCKPTGLQDGAPIQYEADRWNSGFGLADAGKTRVSLFMRRWMSRFTLEIESVRVERLLDVSDADALAEGIIPRDVIVDTAYEGGGHAEKWGERYHFGKWPCDVFESPKEAYLALWDSINGPGSWDANPWVWVVTFKRANQ